MKKLVALMLTLIMAFSLSSVVMAYDEDVNVDTQITRGQFVSVLYRVECAINTNVAAYENVFGDVEVGSTHRSAIAWAAAAGITVGVGGNNFAPDEYITREQMATMVYRYYTFKGIKTETVSLDCADADEVSSYAVDGVKFALAENMIETDAENKVNPASVVTGDELREVLGNFYFNEVK